MSFCLFLYAVSLSFTQHILLLRQRRFVSNSTLWDDMLLYLQNCRSGKTIKMNIYIEREEYTNDGNGNTKVEEHHGLK